MKLLFLSFSLSVILSIVLAQAQSNDTLICFQTVSSGSSNVIALADFITPAIPDACNFFSSNASDPGPIAFDLTGYSFIRINVDLDPPDLNECTQAFNAIVSQCVEDSSPNFGGWWSDKLESAYFLTNVAYPNNPILNSTPLTSTVVPTGTAAAISATTSSTITSSLLPPSSSPSDIAQSIEEDLVVASLAVFLFVAVSWMEPILAKPEAILASAALNIASDSVLDKVSQLPSLESIPKLTGALEATKVASTASEIFPNPIAGALLAVEIASALAAAAEVIEEAEEEEQQTSTAAASTSTSTSSAQPTATEYAIGLSDKWPSLLIDAFVEAFPENGTQVDFSGLKLSTFTTEMSDQLASIVSLLPIFTYVVPNVIPAAIQGDMKRRSQPLPNPPPILSSPTDTSPRKHVLPQRSLEKRDCDTRFPRFDAITIAEEFDEEYPDEPAPLHLRMISFKEGSIVGDLDAYYHESVNRGKRSLIYVLDSGFGPGGTDNIDPTAVMLYDDDEDLTQQRTDAVIAMVKPLMDNDILFVMAGSQAHQPNDIVWELDYVFPQGLAKLDQSTFPFIIVGGVDKNGNGIAETFVGVDWISLYAQYTVQCFGLVGDQYAIGTASGTSFATPAVSGVLAEWLSVPEILTYVNEEVEGDNFPDKVRNFLRDTSLTDNFDPDNGRYNVLYNGYRDGPCEYSQNPDNADSNPDRRRQDSNEHTVVANGTIVDPSFYSGTQCASTTPGSLPSTAAASTTPVSPPTTTFSTSTTSITSTTSTSSSSSIVPTCLATTPLCTVNSCNGTFVNGIATCTTAIEAGCTCYPTSTTPGFTCPNSLSCGQDQCAGTFDANGVATCKLYAQGCQCVPTSQNCGAEQSCDLNGCAGSFDSNGIATCKGEWATCPCLLTANTCGTEQSCGLNGCAGTFDSNGVATCKGFYATCPCIPTAADCGAEQSCDLNGCAGSFDSDGIATCKGEWATCPCLPTANTCGNEQSCDLNGCAGTFDSDGIATCKGEWATCPCLPTANTCGNEQSCDLNNCAGAFDGDGIASCTNWWAGCECLPTSNTCGAWQYCDLNGCAGSFNSDGTATCKGEFATCECLPTSDMCGSPQSCDLNNCDGSFDSDGIATCKNWWDTCQCSPTANTCGSQLSCQQNGCAGTSDGDGNGWCQGSYAGCSCKANVYTPGFCPELGSWGFVAGCSGIPQLGQFGACQIIVHQGCPCTEANPMNPPAGSITRSFWEYIMYSDYGCSVDPYAVTNTWNTGSSSVGAIHSVCVPVGFPGDWQVVISDYNNNVLQVLNSDNAGCPGEQPGNYGCFGSGSIGLIDVVQIYLCLNVRRGS